MEAKMLAEYLQNAGNDKNDKVVRVVLSADMLEMMLKTVRDHHLMGVALKVIPYAHDDVDQSYVSLTVENIDEDSKLF